MGVGEWLGGSRLLQNGPAEPGERIPAAGIQEEGRMASAYCVAIGAEIRREARTKEQTEIIRTSFHGDCPDFDVICHGASLLPTHDTTVQTGEQPPE